MACYHNFLTQQEILSQRELEAAFSSKHLVLNNTKNQLNPKLTSRYFQYVVLVILCISMIDGFHNFPGSMFL